MSYCLNPACSHPQNSPQDLVCQSCGAKLLLRERYRAIKSIGQGGFGKTFLGIDQDKPSKPPCVIKFFYPSSQGTNSTEKAIELFNQEAERLDSLGKHPQIPELLAHFEQESKLYLVQEYIDGKNLAQELQDEGVFSETQIRELLTILLPVLQFIHENNVIHRDIKPENIIKRYIPPLSRGVRGDQYVLVDFGAARYVTGTALLKTGTTIGDVRYMADEQLQGKATFASDIFGLGLTCLHLLTHVVPWDLFDSSEGEWVWRDYVTTPVSQELGQVLDKMVQKPTKRRFQSAIEVLSALNPSRMLSNVEIQPSSAKVESLPVSPVSVTSSVSSAAPLSSQLTRIMVDGRYGYKDETGNIVIPLQFDHAEPFKEGLARVKLNGKHGYIDITGKIVIQPQFDEAWFCFSRELAGVKLNGKWGYIDKTGKIVTQPLFDEVYGFSEGLARIKLNGKWGYIDKTGKIVTQPLFDKVSDFSEGLARVKLNGKYGYIDTTGKIVIQSQFDEVSDFSEGLAIVLLNYKYGYIDKTGRIVIQPQFDDAGDFNDGKAKVKINGFLGFGGKEGYIDKTGKWLE